MATCLILLVLSSHKPKRMCIHENKRQEHVKGFHNFNLFLEGF